MAESSQKRVHLFAFRRIGQGFQYYHIDGGLQEKCPNWKIKHSYNTGYYYSPTEMIEHCAKSNHNLRISMSPSEDPFNLTQLHCCPLVFPMWPQYI
jgi:hypothetical protein